MSEEIRCPTCNSALRFAEELRGREVKCPRCDSILTVPAGQQGALHQAPREQEPGIPRTGIRRRDDERDEREPLPRRLDFDEDEDYRDVRRRSGRAYALSRVRGPGTVLQVYGVCGLLAAVLMLLWVVELADSASTPLSRRQQDDAIGMVVGGGLGWLLGVLGALIWWGGTRMKKLRSYGLAITAVVLTFVLVGALLGLGAIWPLIVLIDPAVREQFQ
jgi:phage FluMu protein Com